MNPNYGLLISPQRGEMFIGRMPYTPSFSVRRSGSQLNLNHATSLRSFERKRTWEVVLPSINISLLRSEEFILPTQ